MMRFLPQGWSTKYDASLNRRAAAARQRTAMAAFYRRFFRPGELCFDVGANKGDRTAVLLTISTLSEQWKSEGRFAGKNQWIKAVPVEVTTLDRLIARYGMPAFCKIDVEGFELYVRSG
jgi:hypothetical protein